MSDQELCYECNAPTGRAGAAEDSLYHGDLGPFCEDCFERLPEEWHDEAVGLRRQLATAREAARIVNSAPEMPREAFDTYQAWCDYLEALRTLAVLDGEDKADG